jgi:hypothetical protein
MEECHIVFNCAKRLILSKYIRFVCNKKIYGSKAREGFFCAAYELQSNEFIDKIALSQVDECLSWFKLNLPIPDRFNRSASKGAWRRETTAGLSWFKEDAIIVIKKSFELANILRENGFAIEVLKTERPGYIFYEDEQQTVAEPFFDTPC